MTPGIESFRIFYKSKHKKVIILSTIGISNIMLNTIFTIYGDKKEFNINELIIQNSFLAYSCFFGNSIFFVE